MSQAEIATIPAHQLAPQTAVATPMDMLASAVANGAPTEIMERLLSMQERWQANAARQAFNTALSRVLVELPAITRTGTVDRVKANGESAGTFRHETMQDIARVVNPLLSGHGLSYRFRTETNERGVSVTCILMHEAGHCEETTLTAPYDGSGGKNNVQAIGSTQTYLQRYTLKAALGLAINKDDDGNSSEISDREADWLECIAECKTVQELHAYWQGIYPDVQKLAPPRRKAIIEAKDAAKKALAGAS